MNRERLLFVAVLAILGLWFVLRGRTEPTSDAAVAKGPLVRRAIKSAEYAAIGLGGKVAGEEPFTVVTNERPHPRPVEALEKPKAFDLPNIWPPTSRSVSIDLLDLLRRDGAAPQPGAAQIQLPAAAAAAGGAEGISAEERVDAWKSQGGDQRGRVTAIVTATGTLKEPPRPWPYGKAVMGAQWSFLRALARLEDPERAVQDEGVREVHATSRSKMTFRQRFPDEIGSFQIAIEGKQAGYFRGLKRYLQVQAGQAFEPRLAAGRELLQEGLKATSKDQHDDLLNWSLAILHEARDLVQAGAQEQRRQILLAMLRAAGEVNDYETVLRLAIDHLDTFPREPEVLEHVGDVLASRTFSLAPFAIDWYELASDDASAQRSHIAALVSEGRFEEAKGLLGKGRAGMPGAEQDLLNARVALALGDFDRATALAERHTSGDAAAEAHQIAGAAAYARGDATTAAQEFQKAAEADPMRSTAYSDWGLALAVQGRTEDALLCFARALELDAIDNAVAPEVGRGYLKLAAGEAALRAAADADDAGRREPRARRDKAEEAQRLRSTAAEEFAGAAEFLGKLRDNNPNDLLVRYMLGYAKERSGNLEEAATLYRSTIDGDWRYRIAIARLGLVQAQRVLAGQDKDLAPAAVAHLSKAVELNPKDPILPYLLARFLMATAGADSEKEQKLALADRMFEKAGKLEVSDRNGDLPLWADLGRACLAYANEKEDVPTAKRLLNALIDRIKEKMPAGSQKLMEHEVYRAAQVNLWIVEDNEKKWDRTWAMTETSKRPADWTPHMKLPMEVRWELGKGLVFLGTINYEGGSRGNPTVPLEYCSASYESKDLTGGSIWELSITGVTPPVPADGEIAELGIGIVNPRRGDQVQGVQVKRKRNGNMEVRIDGGDRQVLKEAKLEWVELKNVAWPAGEFRLKIDVVPDYTTKDKRRIQGRFRLYLNDEEVFVKQFGDDIPGERANVVALSKASTPVQVYIWAEGRDGTQIQGLQVKTVTLTFQK